MAATKKTPIKHKKQQKGIPSKVSSIFFSHKRLFIVLAIFMFSGIGAYLTFDSDAASTNLSYHQCVLRGRVHTTSGHPTKPRRICQYKCQPGAGSKPVTKKRGSSKGYIAYCPGAVSVSVTEAKCKELRRRIIGGGSSYLGCARVWTQKTTKNARQCANSKETYTVKNPYDYCGNPATANIWVWPVPSTKNMGSLPYGASGSKGVHKGIDIGVSGGGSLGATVVAAHAGVVNRVWGTTDSCGSYVSITATGTPYYAAYQHLGGISVRAGQSVVAGQKIGTIGRQGGSTCGSSGFYHLHFSIERSPGMVSAYANSFPNGTINPCNLLPGC